MCGQTLGYSDNSCQPTLRSRVVYDLTAPIVTYCLMMTRCDLVLLKDENISCSLRAIFLWSIIFFQFVLHMYFFLFEMRSLSSCFFPFFNLFSFIKSLISFLGLVVIFFIQENNIYLSLFILQLFFLPIFLNIVYRSLFLSLFLSILSPTLTIKLIIRANFNSICAQVYNTIASSLLLKQSSPLRLKLLHNC